MAKTTIRILTDAILLLAAMPCFGQQLPVSVEYRHLYTYGSKYGIHPPKVLNKKPATAAMGEDVHPYGLGFPVGVTTDLRNRVWITDSGTNSVHIFDPAALSGYREIRRTPDGEFQQPSGIATDDSGHIYIADSALGQVFVFDEKGEYERALISKKNGRVLKGPTAIAVTRNRRVVYVADPPSKAVFAFNQEGEVNGTVAMPADLPEPTAMQVIENDLYVLGNAHDGARIFTATGNPKAEKQWGEIRFPPAFAYCPGKNRFAVMNPRYTVIEIFDGGAAGTSLGVFGQTGDGVDQMRRIDALHMDSKGNVYAVDSRHGKVLVFGEVAGSGRNAQLSAK